jgi:DNA-binding XRE family transcriptional regulator
VTEPAYGGAGGPGAGESAIEVVPVVVLSQVFTARPSSIPDIRDFVRRCLAESPLTPEGNREVGETVFRALLDAAGPTGSIQVAFRIFPEHVEVDVLHSDTVIQPPTMPGPPVAVVQPGTVPAPPEPGAYPTGGKPSAFTQAAQLSEAMRGGQGAGVDRGRSGSWQRSGPNTGYSPAGGAGGGSAAGGVAGQGSGASAGAGISDSQGLGAVSMGMTRPGGAGSNGAGSGGAGSGGAGSGGARSGGARSGGAGPDGAGQVGADQDGASHGDGGPPGTFAEWMSSALRREGLTQEAAARQLGVSVKTVSRWVGGATEPRMRDLRRIQEVFGEVPLP